MKKSILFSACILFIMMNAGILNAQILKGTFSLGPSINFTSSSTEIDGFPVDIKSRDLVIGLSGGYYFIDNLEAGLSFFIISSKDEIGTLEFSSSGIAIGPHIEYNIGLSPQFYIPIGGVIAFNSVTEEDGTGNESTSNGLSYGLYTGIEFIANNKLGAALLVGPSFGSLKDDDSSAESDLTTFSASIGVNFYF